MFKNIFSEPTKFVFFVIVGILYILLLTLNGRAEPTFSPVPGSVLMRTDAFNHLRLSSLMLER